MTKNYKKVKGRVRKNKILTIRMRIKKNSIVKNLNDFQNSTTFYKELVIFYICASVILLIFFLLKTVLPLFISALELLALYLSLKKFPYPGLL